MFAKKQKKTNKACRQRLARSPAASPGPCKSAEWLSHSPLPGIIPVREVFKGMFPEWLICWFPWIGKKSVTHWISNFVLFLMNQFVSASEFIVNNLTTNLKKLFKSLTRDLFQGRPSIFSPSKPASFAYPIPPQSEIEKVPSPGAELMNCCLQHLGGLILEILVIHILSWSNLAPCFSHSHQKNHHLLEAFWTQVTKLKNGNVDISLC